MLDFSLTKHSLKLYNKCIRHVFYLQFLVNTYHIFFLISVNEVIYDDV